MSLILIGFKGVGKSYFGKKCAEVLKVDFYDTDQEIEKYFFVQEKKKMTCRHIYELFGEEIFRKRETQAIQKLNYQKKCVIAFGGGSLENIQSFEDIKKMATVVYLRLDKEVLWEKLKDNKPVFLKDKKTFEDLLKKRSTQYETWADHTINITHLEKNDIIKELTRIFYGQ
jgi:shikimate kinase